MSTIIIRDLPEDKTLDREAMLSLRGGYSFTSRFIPTDPIRTLYPTDPVHPVDTNLGIYSLSPIRT